MADGESIKREGEVDSKTDPPPLSRTTNLAVKIHNCSNCSLQTHFIEIECYVFIRYICLFVKHALGAFLKITASETSRKNKSEVH